MTQLSGLTVGALLAICLQSAIADGKTGCVAPALAAQGLEQSECSVQDGLTLSRHVGSVPVSPYSTVFDQRSVVVVHGTNAAAVRESAGITTGLRGMSLLQSRLVRPPAEDQIARRTAARSASKHREWNVLSERIQYAAQGGAPGFVIDCATALGSVGQQTTAVGECFPLEERQRFFRTLDATR